MKMQFKQNIFLLFIGLFILLEIGAIFAADGVYVLKLNEESVLRPVLLPFDSNGEINIGSGQTVYLGKSVDGRDGVKPLGFVENVKIKKEGNNLAVMFKDKGSLSVTSEDLKRYDYNNLKSDSGFYFDNNGQIVKLNVETLDKKTFNLNGQIYEVSEGTQLNFENGEVKVNSKGESFSYYPENKIDKKQIFSNLKDGAEFKVNKDGKLVEASFEVSVDSEINLRGYKYKLAKDSKVSLKDNKIDIRIPDGTKVESPEKTSDSEEGVVFSFRTLSGKAITLSNGDLFEVKDEENVLYSNGEGFYFTSENAVIKNNEGKEDFLIQNKEKGEVDLVFDKTQIKENRNSIFIGNENGKNSLILTSLGGKGPAIFFTENNRYGISITGQNTVAAQANNGKVFIEQGEPGKVASIKLSGDSISTLDRRSFYGENNKFYFDPVKQIESNFNYGASSAAAKIMLVDNNGIRLKDISFDVYSNNQDQYASVVDGSFKNVGNIEFFRTSGDFYVSSAVAFNQLSFEAQEIYDEIDPEDLDSIASYTSLGKENVAELQRRLLEIAPKSKFKFNANTLEEFEQVTGITVVGATNYLTPGRMASLQKLAQELPLDVVKDVKKITLWSGNVVNEDGNVIGGFANGDGIQVSVNNLDDWNSDFNSRSKGFNIGSFFHESFHQHAFAQGSDFRNEWSSLNKYNPRMNNFDPPNYGYAWGYGSKGFQEDIATFGDYTRYPEYWTQLISDSNPYSTIYRAKLAVLRQYNFITQNQYKEIFKLANLPYNKASIPSYINAGRV